ncbi:hypothetical protein AAVH_30440 [Aphelenchoides avenae]|nr:hypothetical protein AAVH_30440 [Aphelenchus avenae]
MLFAGTWYCYEAKDLASAGATASADLIRNNYCQTLVPSYDVVKVVDPREWGYSFWIQDAVYKGTTVYLGMVLASGTTYNW